MYVYHVVTDRPMYVGQEIIFDKEHHSGVYQRVQEKAGFREAFAIEAGFASNNS